MEKQEYEKSVLEYEDVKDAMAYQREKGIEEGLAEGMKKGIEKGMLQTAAKFLELGISVSDVMKATGLTEEEVMKLKGGN